MYPRFTPVLLRVIFEGDFIWLSLRAPPQGGACRGLRTSVAHVRAQHFVSHDAKRAPPTETAISCECSGRLGSWGLLNDPLRT
jgi:hypothetical protein